MDQVYIDLYLKAGEIIGKSKICGKKLKYKSEQTAKNAAKFLSYNRRGKHV